MLVPSGPSNNPEQLHLHIVCNDTCQRGLNLLVPVCTFYDGCDRTCELDVGDHPFLRHLSYVFYAEAKIVQAERIDLGFRVGRLHTQPDMDVEVFERVAAGVCASPDTARGTKAYYGC